MAKCWCGKQKPFCRHSNTRNPGMPVAEEDLRTSKDVGKGWSRYSGSALSGGKRKIR